MFRNEEFRKYTNEFFPEYRSRKEDNDDKSLRNRRNSPSDRTEERQQSKVSFGKSYTSGIQ